MADTFQFCWEYYGHPHKLRGFRKKPWHSSGRHRRHRQARQEKACVMLLTILLLHKQNCATITNDIAPVDFEKRQRRRLLGYLAVSFY